MDKTVYRRLANIVGPEWVSDEIEICTAYSRDRYTYARFGHSRSADYIVMPESTMEIQNIVYIARQFKIPIIVFGTGINQSSACISRRGGIVLDLKRMDRILEINQENMTATVQPYVSLARLSCELQKRKMFVPIPGAPSTASVISNYTYGNANKASNRLGWQYRSILGLEMVLPDGTILRTGSAADSFLNEGFWPHGPGPDLWLLPRYAFGAHGIVTAMSVKCHPLDEKFKIFLVAFDDIDAAASAYSEVIREEIGTGSGLYGGFKYIGYASDTAECARRQNAIHPEFMLVLTFQGTQRRVEHEEKVTRNIAKKHGGRVITDSLPFYQMFVDSHISMAGSLASDNTLRYFGSPGNGPGGLVPTSLDKIAEAYKIASKVASEDTVLGDPDIGDFEFNRGLICYSDIGGHHVFFEFFMAGHMIDPLFIETSRRFIPRLLKEFAKAGLCFDQTRLNQRLGEFGIMPSYLDLLETFRRSIDPDNIMNSGALLPLIYR